MTPLLSSYEHPRLHPPSHPFRPHPRRLPRYPHRHHRHRQLLGLQRIRTGAWSILTDIIIPLALLGIAIAILSFQGPDGGLTFPMNGVSVHWFANLFQTPVPYALGTLTTIFSFVVIVLCGAIAVALQRRAVKA